MGGLGSDAAIEAAGRSTMDDQPSKTVGLAIRIARRTLAIARQNVVFAIGVKVAVLLLAVCGIATMWLAVFADVGVTVLAVLNAMRAPREFPNFVRSVTVGLSSDGEPCGTTMVGPRDCGLPRHSDQ